MDHRYGSCNEEYGAISEKADQDGFKLMYYDASDRVKSFLRSDTLPLTLKKEADHFRQSQSMMGPYTRTCSQELGQDRPVGRCTVGYTRRDWQHCMNEERQIITMPKYYGPQLNLSLSVHIYSPVVHSTRSQTSTNSINVQVSPKLSRTVDSSDLVAVQASLA